MFAMVKGQFPINGTSARAEFYKMKTRSTMNFNSVTKRHFLLKTEEFPPALKIPLTGNWPLVNYIFLMSTNVEGPQCAKISDFFTSYTAIFKSCLVPNRYDCAQILKDKYHVSDC